MITKLFGHLGVGGMDILPIHILDIVLGAFHVLVYNVSVKFGTGFLFYTWKN